SSQLPMIDMSWLWAVFTLIAAAGQTARNAMQRELTAKLGTVGATHVRFLFGCPFALVFLAAVLLAKGVGPPHGGTAFWLWIGAGSWFRLAAVGYRGAILALNSRDFVLAATYTLAVGLTLQASLLSLYLAVRTPAVLRAIVLAWRPSLFAGAMGAFASQFWFL